MRRRRDVETPPRDSTISLAAELMSAANHFGTGCLTRAQGDTLTAHDSEGRVFSIRLERFALPIDSPVRTFVNTISDVHVIQVSTSLCESDLVARLQHELAEIFDARCRAFLGGPRLKTSDEIVELDPVRSGNPAWVKSAREARLSSRRTARNVTAMAEHAMNNRNQASLETIRRLRDSNSGGAREDSWRRLVVGGGATLVARDPEWLVVNDFGGWHRDPISGLVQSPEQLRLLRTCTIDPYDFADATGRFPVEAVRYLIDKSACRGPMIKGTASLRLTRDGLVGEIDPADGSGKLRVALGSSPIIATGAPPESIPGTATHPDAASGPNASVRGHRLPRHRSPRTLNLREWLRYVDKREGYPVRYATRTPVAISKWNLARRLAPNRVFFGDQIGRGAGLRTDAACWLIAGAGGSAACTAEIILERSSDSTVVMVGRGTPQVLYADSQFQFIRRKYDASWGGNGRLKIVIGREIGPIEMRHAPGDRLVFAIHDIVGDGYVACLGRRGQLPSVVQELTIEDGVELREVTVKALLSGCRDYLGYTVTVRTTTASQQLIVTGAASRFPPRSLMSSAELRIINECGLRDAPRESGNVPAGFLASAIQAKRLIAHMRATGM